MILGANGRPWYHASKKLARNPFDPMPLVQHLEYCKTCKMDVDAQVEVGNAGGIDVYRKVCKRCGRILQHGCGMRAILGDNLKPLPRAALEFINKRGKDRR